MADQAKLQVQQMASIERSIYAIANQFFSYLDGKVTKTELVNQLNKVGTPDVIHVVRAVNSLHDTLKTHQNTDLSEVTGVMREVLAEAKKIPKDKFSLPEKEDYSKQFASLENAINAVEKVVKAQKLVMPAPVVKIPEPKVTVAAPNLIPLQTSIREVVTAVKSIAIPEYKSDTTNIEKLLNKSNKLLSDLLDKPISSGGGGGGRATPYQDNAGTPAFVSLDHGSVPVMPENGVLPFSYDDIQFSNADGNGNYQTGTFKNSGSTVATLSFTFDASNNVTRITRS